MQISNHQASSETSQPLNPYLDEFQEFFLDGLENKTMDNDQSSGPATNFNGVPKHDPLHKHIPSASHQEVKS